jgi:hypothetical protein
MLARMIAVDKSALECDFAETYRIYDFRMLPARRAAMFAAGLGDSSRIMRKLGGAPTSFESMMLATIADAVRILVWQNTKDGVEGRNAPESIISAILDKGKESSAFDSADDFEQWRNSILNGE